MQLTISNIFNIVLYQPLVNLLIIFYLYLPGHSLGLAIIAITLLVKILLYPSTQQSLKSQKLLNEIQPLVKDIQKKYKDDQKRQADEMMKLYKEKNFNPFSGFLPLLIQLPLLIALYNMLRTGIGQEHINLLYSFIQRPQEINQMFFGLDLSKPSLIFAVVVGIAQYFQGKTSTPPAAPKSGNDDQMAQFSGIMQKYILYFFPIMTVAILAALPSGLGIYWLTTTLFTIGQNYFVFRKK
jgi:YidC/Oxa1 family membrane protein insertase